MNVVNNETELREIRTEIAMIRRDMSEIKLMIQRLASPQYSFPPYVAQPYPPPPPPIYFNPPPPGPTVWAPLDPPDPPARPFPGAGPVLKGPAVRKFE